jgi:hypothetical protein
MRNVDKGKEISAVAAREKLPVKIMQLDVTDDTSVKDAIERYCQKPVG